MSGHDPKQDDKRRVAVDDVDDVIGVAEELKSKASEQMTVGEVQSVGRELELSDAVVSRAVDELEKRRRREALEERMRARTVRRRTIAVAGSILALLVLSLFAQSWLRSVWTGVETERSQMRTVLDRQTSVHARYDSEPASAARDSAISGAENRVAIQRRRYDEAVARYNRAAQGFPGGLVRALTDLPPRAPLSDEVRTW
jgi:hypothetical protein